MRRNVYLPPLALVAALTLLLFFAHSSELVAAASTPVNFAFKDFLIVPLRIHLLSATNATNWHTTLDEKDIPRIVAKVNTIWAQAGFHFYVDAVVREQCRHLEHYDEYRKRGDLPWL